MGFTGLEFRCPKCNPRGELPAAWGTERGNVGTCHTAGCNFRWSRRHDFRVFVRARDGRPFESPVELEAFVAGVALRQAPRLASSAETLYELLAELMAAPPTVAVIERWTMEEKHAALAWASREVLALDGEDVTRVERPKFVEEGAATA